MTTRKICDRCPGERDWCTDEDGQLGDNEHSGEGLKFDPALTMVATAEPHAKLVFSVRLEGNSDYHVCHSCRLKWAAEEIAKNKRLLELVRRAARRNAGEPD